MTTGSIGGNGRIRVYVPTRSIGGNGSIGMYRAAAEFRRIQENHIRYGK